MYAIGENPQSYDVLLPFTESDWQIHQGLASIILISAGGGNNTDYALAGQMAETAFLQKAPQLKALLMSLQRSWSRCKLVRIPLGEHDLQEHSFHRVIRHVIYIPLVQLDPVQFYVDGQAVSVQEQPLHVAGKLAHKISNSQRECVYMVCETRHANPEHNAPFLEPHQFDVLTPEHLQQLVAVIIDALAQSGMDSEKSASLQQQLHDFVGEWTATFAHFGKAWAGELSYQNLVQDFSALMNGKQNYLHSNAKHALSVIESVLKTQQQTKAKRHFSRYFFAAQQPLPDLARCPRFEKPIFIISAPRAGSTLLFETLAQFPGVWTIGEESHELIEDIPELHPSAQGFKSNRLTETQATPEVVEELKKRFVRQLRDRAGNNYLKLTAEQVPNSVRFLEKTPKNALRIPFLKAAFPDALFVYLYRSPEENISSLLEGWRSLRFVAYRNLPNWAHKHWSFFLPDDWQSLHSTPLAAIAAHQWRYCNDTIINDLQTIPASDWYQVSYADLVAQPYQTLMDIAHFAELDKDNDIHTLLTNGLPVSRLTLSKPASNKWHKYAAEINGLKYTAS